MTTRAATVAEVVGLLETWGGDPYDEEVTQLAHALQTAALAEEAGAAEELVAAALLHDVGHLLVLACGAAGPPDGDDGHERSGPRYLGSVFPPAVTRPIELHVSAKRYRCAVDPEYRARLSDGSVRSLARQGGPMSPAEAALFETEEGWSDAVRLREWDDAAKIVGLGVPPLAYYGALLDEVARLPGA